MTLKLPSEYRSVEDLPEPSCKRDPSDRRRWNLFWDFLSPRPEEYIVAWHFVRRPWSKLDPCVRWTLQDSTLDMAQCLEQDALDEMGFPCPW